MKIIYYVIGKIYQMLRYPYGMTVKLQAVRILKKTCSTALIWLRARLWFWAKAYFTRLPLKNGLIFPMASMGPLLVYWPTMSSM